MKKRFLSILLIMAMLLSLCMPAALANSGLTAATVSMEKTGDDEWTVKVRLADPAASNVSFLVFVIDPTDATLTDDGSYANVSDVTDLAGTGNTGISDIFGSGGSMESATKLSATFAFAKDDQEKTATLNGLSANSTYWLVAQGVDQGAAHGGDAELDETGAVKLPQASAPAAAPQITVTDSDGGATGNVTLPKTVTLTAAPSLSDTDSADFNYTYTWTKPDAGTVTGESVTINTVAGTGTYSVTATRTKTDGSTSMSDSSAETTQAVTITKGAYGKPTLSASASTFEYGSGTFGVTLTPTAAVGDTVADWVYAGTGTSVAITADGTLSLSGSVSADKIGISNFTVKAKGNDNYTESTASDAVSVEITQGTPVVDDAVTLTVMSGTKYSEIAASHFAGTMKTADGTTVSGAFARAADDSNTASDVVTATTVKYTFTPDDTTLYKTVSGTVTAAVTAKKTLAVEGFAFGAASAVYGETLPTLGTPVFKNDGATITLTAGTDYDIAYSDGTNSGKATVNDASFLSNASKNKVGTYTATLTLKPTAATAAYQIDATTASFGVTAKDITELDVTGVTATAATYNASSAATVSGNAAIKASSLISGDAVTLATPAVTSGVFYNATVETANVDATRIKLTISSTLSGADGGNYALNLGDLFVTGSIAAKTVTMDTTGVTVNTKSYDGLTVATLNKAPVITTGGIVGGDTVSLKETVAPAFADAGVASGKTVTATYVLDGADKGNYTLTSGALSLTGTIQTKGVALSATKDSVDTKVGSAANVDAGDNITVAGLTKGDANGYALTYSVTDAGTTGMTTGAMGSSTTPSPSATGTATIQVTATLQGTAATNYTFGVDGDSAVTATKNISVVVAAGLFTVSFDGNGSTSGSTAGMVNQAIGSASTITANGFARTGHAFEGWSYTATGVVQVAAGAALSTLKKQDGTTALQDGDSVTLYAVWAPAYTLALVASPAVGGTVTDTTDAAPYKSGTSVNIEAVANTGYTFGTWTVTTGTGTLGAAGNATTTYTVGGEDATLTATVTPNALTWAYAANTNSTAGSAVSVAAPTLQSGIDATSGTVAYAVNSVSDDDGVTSLAAYGLTLGADGTITGTPAKAGTLTVTVDVTGKNGHESTTASFTITIAAADLAVTGQTAISKNTSEVSGLKIADFIATATPLLGTDSIATLFTAAVAPAAGVFAGNGVKITFYTDATRATADAAMNALPTTVGTYYYRVESDTSATQSGVPNANYNLLDFVDADGVLTLTTPPAPPSGGGGVSSYTVTYDVGEHGTLAEGAAKTEKVNHSKAPNAPAIVAAAGYKFMGWSVDGKTVLDMTMEKVTKAVTYKAVYAAYDHKPYMVGIGEGVFAPTGTLTRAEAATMLARLTPGFAEGTAYANDFIDAQDGWYTSYIGFAAANGIAFGVGDGLFQPMRTITRGEFAAMLARFMGLEPATDLSACPFSDCAGHWTEGYILALHRAGVLDGLADGTVQPDRSITREEAAKMVNVAIGRTPSKTQMDKTISEYTNPYGDVSVDLWSFYHIMEASVKHVSNDFHGEN